MKLSIKGLALAFGISWGVGLFLWTLLNAVTDIQWGVDALDIMAGIYPYFEVTVPGAFVGLVAGFVDGLIGGALIAWLYNKFAK